MSEPDEALADAIPPELLPPELAEGASARRESIRAAAQRSLPRRRLTKRLAFAACGVAVALSLAPLVALVTYATSRGIRAFSLSFFIHNPTPPGIPGGGILNAVVGTVLITGMGTLIAVPLGIIVALFLLERRGIFAAGLRLGAGILTGVPSIAVGIFAFSVLVRPIAHFSALAGSFAIAVLMLPVVIRSSEAAMRAVPVSLREAALALGAHRSRVARSVVLRAAVPGLVTGSLLALARAVGETAPLLFTAIGSPLLNLSPFQPTAAMPLVVYNDGTQPFAGSQTTAWGTAFVLLVLVLVLSIVARLLSRRRNGDQQR
jgi:phosphate transport system permease protein